MKSGFLLCLMICVACASQTVSSPIFEVSYPQDKKDEIKVHSARDKVLVEVSSAHGIGSGTINLRKGQWPDQVLVHLRLKGLEGFTVSNGIMELDKSDLSVQVFTDNGNVWNHKYLMSELGYYEVQLPKSLFVDGVNSIAIQWVDFYR